MISDKEFFGFTWPPNMSYFKPKQKKHYKHLAIITSNKDPELGYVFEFSSEPKARSHIKTARLSTNNISAVYEKKEQPLINEEGIIL